MLLLRSTFRHFCNGKDQSSLSFHLQTDRYISGTLNHVEYKASLIKSSSRELIEEIKDIPIRMALVIGEKDLNVERLSPVENHKIALIIAAKRGMVATLAMRDSLMINNNGEPVPWDGRDVDAVQNDYKRITTKSPLSYG